MSASPAEVFRGAGLGAQSWLRKHTQSAVFSTSESAARFAEALARLGGLYRAFGIFLRFRADILEPEYRDALRARDLSPSPLSVGDARSVLRRDLGAASHELERTLQHAPLWNTVCRTAWRAEWKGTAVVVQVAREKVPDADFAQFERGVRGLGHADLARACTPTILRQFREWMRAGENCARERAYLEVLNRNREATLAAYPELIGEASGGQVLTWKFAEGETVAERMRKGDKEAVIAAAAGVLEQFCSLAVVEGNLDASAMILTPQGRLAFRRISHPVAVPPIMVNGGMKYIAAVLTGSDSLAAEQLTFLAAGAYSNDTARDLVGAFSGIEPELRIRLWFPATAATLENNWRALERENIPRRLYLDCFNRNLSALGQWNAEAVAAGAARFDAIGEAQWSVVGRLMRSQAGDLADPKVAAEWMMGAGILMFSAVREFNRMAEEIRENNLTLSVEVTPAPADETGARNLRLIIGVAVLLAAMLGAFHYGPELAGAARVAAVAGSVAAMGGLFWLISRLR